MVSSVSLPGVRIVIEMLQVSRPSGVEKPSRISRGSSTATLSARVSRKPSLIRATSIARLRWDMIVPGLTTGLASI